MLPTIASEFAPMPKIARLSRDCVITEKLDGTNASILITPYIGDGTDMPGTFINGVVIRAGSRTRWISVGDDNYGFAQWVHANVTELCKLGPGHHFGEWWGKGIQRGYGLDEKRFSLFNVDRWSDSRPSCCHVVPVLYHGDFDTEAAGWEIMKLRGYGSVAAPGFMDPEGIVVYHTAASMMFKKTCKGDERGKSQENAPKKEKAPQQPKDKAKGGRRKADLPYGGVDRRVKS